MSHLVAPDRIELLVGARRHPRQHLGRAVSADETIYILHSKECRATGIDLRDCEWSQALDRGIELGEWVGYEDRPVALTLQDGRLFPILTGWLKGLVLA